MDALPDSSLADRSVFVATLIATGADIFLVSLTEG